MTGTEILALLAQVPQASTAKDVIQVAVEEVAGTEVAAADMEMAIGAQVEVEAQAGLSLSRSLKTSSQVTQRMRLSLL